jgi:hypothetical protein
VSYDPDVVTDPVWVSNAQTDRAGFYRLIRDTLLAGGSVFRGEDSVISQLETAAAPARPAMQDSSPA